MSDVKETKDKITAVKDYLREHQSHLPTNQLQEIIDFYKNFYENFYELITCKETTPQLSEDYLKALQEEYEEKMKELENKFIPIEIEVNVKEGDQIVKKKITVNVLARKLLEAIVYRFGIEIFNYLAIRIPPPELYLLMIYNLTSLTKQVKMLESSVLTLTENMLELTELIEKLIDKENKEE